MLIAHFFGDGNGWKGNCREFYLNYRQYDDEILNLFIQKIQRVFGRIKYKEDYFYKLKRIYLPTILSLVLSHYYSLKPKDFLSDKATLPRKMFTHSKDHLLAALIAFIIDEGTVNSSEIVIGLHNKKLILDLSNICKKLKYEFSVTREKFNPKRYILYILANGVKNFWEDYKNLKKKYPEIFLGYKEDQIKQFILRKEKLWRSNNGGSTKNNIINLLKQKSRTIKELAEILDISRQGIKFHLQQLEKIGLIKRGGKGKKNSDIYDLLKYVQFPVTKRGRSRQYGVTAEKIIQLLMELGSLDTKQISKRLKMKRTSVYTILKKLEKEKKIIAINKKVYRTHPTTVWSLI